ncbi:MAG: GNAT family N-acetyltransferase [Anaerolineaceae bacterium]|nr:GNAT family N-acetyltransferase [Anaerolineaceae bacterium]
MPIVTAYDGQPLEHVITLAKEYVAWMVAEIVRQYPELQLAEFTSEHEYDDVRKKFPGEHVPPHGCLLLATDGQQAAGCIAVGRLEAGICELRTLFVRPAYRGKGIGHQLVDAALSEARNMNYRRARLDTLGFMIGAQTLYRAYGFTDIPPYLPLSEDLRRYIHFMELTLQ